MLARVLWQPAPWGELTALGAHAGQFTDVPAGDIGVGAREVGFMFGQYKCALPYPTRPYPTLTYPSYARCIPRHIHQ